MVASIKNNCAVIVELAVSSAVERVALHRTARVQWRGSFEGYARNFVKKQLWRIEPLMEYADAVQECALLFVKLKSKYADKVDNPKWLMALFKTAIRNRWNSLSNDATKRRLNEKVVEDLSALRQAFVDDAEALIERIDRTRRSSKMTVYEELKEKLGFEAPPSTDELMDRISNMQPTEWEQLSPEAHTWYNETAKAFNEGKPLEPCPGEKEYLETNKASESTAPASDDAPAPAAEGKKVKVKPPKEPKAAKAPKVPKEKKAKEPKPPKERVRRESSSKLDEVFDLLVAQSEKSPAELVKVLEARGTVMKPITLATYLYDVRRTLAAIARIPASNEPPANMQGPTPADTQSAA